MRESHQESQAVPGLLRRLNERKVIGVLMREGACSRADLSRLTKISPPTISKAIASLVALGLVEGHARHENKTGRPGKLYSLANESVHVLGVSIAGEGCWVGSSGMDGVVRDESLIFIETPSDYESLIDELEGCLGKLIGDQPARVLGLGVCVAGHVNHACEEVVRCHGVSYLGGRSPGVDLAERLGCSSHLASRAQAMCMVENQGREGVGSVLELDAADGLTCGLSLGGKLVVGDYGLGGSLGYMPVSLSESGMETRFLADLATDSALARMASVRLGREMSMDGVVEYVGGGGEELNDLVDETLGYLAMGIATLVNLMDVGCLRVYAKLLDMERSSLEKLRGRVDQFLVEPLEGRCAIERSSVRAVNGALVGMVNQLVEQLGEGVDGGD